MSELQVAAPPVCEACSQPMGWLELLRTWACADCGYFLNDVCARCGQVEGGASCRQCGQKMPTNKVLGEQG